MEQAIEEYNVLRLPAFVDNAAPASTSGHKGGRGHLTKSLFQQYGQTLKQKRFEEKDNRIKPKQSV